MKVWEDQRPFEVVDPKKLSVRKLENYFLTLMAMEDNLKEYQELKDQLVKIFREVCDLNEDSDDEEGGRRKSIKQIIAKDYLDYAESISSSDDEGDDEDEDDGDIMSALIKGTGKGAKNKKINKLVGEYKRVKNDEANAAMKNRRKSVETTEVVGGVAGNRRRSTGPDRRGSLTQVIGSAFGGSRRKSLEEVGLVDGLTAENLRTVEANNKRRSLGAPVMRRGSTDPTGRRGSAGVAEARFASDDISTLAVHSGVLNKAPATGKKVRPNRFQAKRNSLV